jgi:hypothetical protein
VFAVDLLLWFVSVFSLLMLACSMLFISYLCIRITLKILFSALSREPHVRATRPAAGDVPSTPRNVKPATAAVYKDHNLSTETAQKSSASWRSALACAIVREIRVHTRSHRASRLRSSKVSNSTTNDCEFGDQVSAPMCRPDKTRPL